MQNRYRMTDELTRGEIRDRLTAFAARWTARAGDERKEAQQFLIELLECYGVDWHSSPHVFEHTFDDGTRADLLWPARLLVEMKSASHSEHLEKHLPQAKGYWEQAGDIAHDVPRPEFMILCSFRRLIVYELGAFGESPRAQLSLDELPERLEVLNFLRDRPAQFDLNTVDLARSAVDAMTALYLSLIERNRAGGRPRLHPAVHVVLLCRGPRCLRRASLHRGRKATGPRRIAFHLRRPRRALRVVGPGGPAPDRGDVPRGTVRERWPVRAARPP